MVQKEEIVANVLKLITPIIIVSRYFHANSSSDSLKRELFHFKTETALLTKEFDKK